MEYDSSINGRLRPGVKAFRIGFWEYSPTGEILADGANGHLEAELQLDCRRFKISGNKFVSRIVFRCFRPRFGTASIAFPTMSISLSATSLLQETNSAKKKCLQYNKRVFYFFCKCR